MMPIGAWCLDRSARPLNPSTLNKLKNNDKQTRARAFGRELVITTKGLTTRPVRAYMGLKLRPAGKQRSGRIQYHVTKERPSNP